MKDRRHYVRWQININAKFRLEGAVADVPCIIHNLNFYGARISLARKLPQDRPLKIKISLSEGFTPLDSKHLVEFTFEVVIWVVWHKQIMHRNIYGVYFTQIKDSDKETIYKFMHHNFPGFLNKLRWQIPIGAEKQGGEEKMVDRRVFERILINLPIRLIDIDSNREVEANTCDLSAKGLGIVNRGYLKSGDALELWLRMPDRKEPFYTRGVVVWTKPQGSGEYRTGISLEKAELMGMSRIFRA